MECRSPVTPEAVYVLKKHWFENVQNVCKQNRSKELIITGFRLNPRTDKTETTNATTITAKRNAEQRRTRNVGRYVTIG